MIPSRPVARLTREYLEIQKQVVTFEVPLLGTPLSLHYRSDQVPGRVGRSPLRIPIGPRNPSPGLKAVLLEIDAPGQKVRRTFNPTVRFYRHEFEPAQNSSYSKTAAVRIGHLYRARFPRPELTQWREYEFSVAPWDARIIGLGGWTLNVHHRYDPLEKVVHFGDGRRQQMHARDLIADVHEIEVPSKRGDQLFAFNERGQHLRTLDALTRSVAAEFSYSSSGELLSFRDRNGEETRLRREAGDRIVLAGPAGEELQLRLDGNGFLARIITAGGQESTFSHSATGLLESIVAPGGRRHSYQYDEKGRVIRREEPGGFVSEIIARNDGNHQTVAVLDAQGGELISDRELHESGEIVYRSRCCGGREIKSVTRRDGSEEIAYPDGIVEVIENTSSGTTVRRTLPASRKVSEWKFPTSADPRRPTHGRAVFEANGRRYETVTDAATRTITSTTPEGRKTIVEFDDRGRAVRVSAWSLPAIDRRRDAQGKIVEVVQKSSGEARTWKLSYDQSGRLAEVRDPLGRATRATFDADDRLVKQVGPDGEISYLYSEHGLLQALESAGKRLPISRRRGPGDMAQSEFTFAPGSGLVTNMRSPDGIKIDLTRDGPLITRISYAGPFAGTVSREFGPDMRLVADEVNGNYRVEYQYDRDNLLIQAGKLSIEREPATGRMVRKRIGGVEVVYGYSDFGELREIRCLFKGSEILTISQVHDALGRVVQKNERLEGSSAARQYTYDAAGRLSAIHSDGNLLARFSYDRNGNRLTAEHGSEVLRGQYDSDDRILEFGQWRFEHNGNGDRSSARIENDVFQCDYDPAGPLRRVLLPDRRDVAYLLDAVGRPCQRLLTGQATETFLYDHRHRVLAVIDQRGVPSRFIYATRLNVPEYFEREGRTFILVSDALGNPRLTVDVESGKIAYRVDFDEFGNIIGESGERIHPFGFAGGIYDPLTRLTRFGVRYYDPFTARWTQPDPLGYLVGTNLYEYVAGDPINRIDPLGLESTVTTGGGGVFTLPDQDITITDSPQWVPPEAGTTAVDYLNPSPAPFDWRKWITNPKEPDPIDRRGPYRNPDPTGYDFRFGGVRCVITPRGSLYRTDDTGGLARDPNTGRTLPQNPSNPESQTTVDFGIRF